ncbi:hypothetical protein T492DRAFT_996611 [Pavlovales sp. CCMP2436]|nr:hypothetical protein T492DRAFT_996611 [Pavlovales sp. CCMP2436]|mmetsp:Transcript_3886/g.9839  ORF Transcript_3886/g.9839 Transcript_3886/m.9839 type:complete len:259 (+) Transcript_3886:81-857(+)
MGFPFPLNATISAVDARQDPVVYCIKVTSNSAQTVISKRFSAFHNLKDALKNAGIHNVPSLPGKFHLSDSHDRSLLLERKAGLARFLGECFHDSAIAESDVFVAFMVPAIAGLWEAKLVDSSRIAAQLDDARLDGLTLEGALGRAMAKLASERAVRRVLSVWAQAASAETLLRLRAASMSDAASVVSQATKRGLMGLPPPRTVGTIRHERPPLRGLLGLRVGTEQAATKRFVTSASSVASSMFDAENRDQSLVGFSVN